MPSTSHAGEQPLQDLLRQAMLDGAQWVNAEIALARAELGSLLGGYLTAAGLCVVAAVIVMSAVTTLSLAVVAALVPHTGGFISAGLSVGAGLCVIAIALGLAARQIFRAASKRLSIVERLTV